MPRQRQTRIARRFSAGIPIHREFSSRVATPHRRVPKKERNKCLDRCAKPSPILADTYTFLHYHVAFSTINREPILKKTIRTQLFPYMTGFAAENGLLTLEMGGVLDHVHLLVAVPASMPLSQAVLLLKGGSAHWMNESFLQRGVFRWQDGYGALTVSQSQIDSVQRYIQNQEEHHRTKTFAEEYRLFLRQHGVAFDEQFLLG